MSESITLKDIIKEIEIILDNDNYKIEDESRLHKIIGQLIINEMKSTIDKWDGLSIPKTNYEISLYEIFEELFNIYIGKKLNSYLYHIVEFRNIAWGDNLEFCISNSKINTLNILDKNNNVHKKELIDGRATLEMDAVYFPFESYFDNFLRSKLLDSGSFKGIIKLVLSDIEKYIEDKVNILQDNTKMVDVLTEKPIKIGIDNCIICNKGNGLCLYMRIGVGILGGKE
jgi:hypothetical protein